MNCCQDWRVISSHNFPTDRKGNTKARESVLGRERFKSAIQSRWSIAGSLVTSRMRHGNNAKSRRRCSIAAIYLRRGFEGVSNGWIPRDACILSAEKEGRSGRSGLASRNEGMKISGEGEEALSVNPGPRFPYRLSISRIVTCR